MILEQVRSASAAEKIAINESIARSQNWDEWILEHPELEVVKDKEGSIIDIVFPENCVHSSYAISSGKVSALSYKLSTEAETQTFNSGNNSLSSMQRMELAYKV